MIFSTENYIPDLLVNWPWKKIRNPHLASVEGASVQWIESLELFESKQLRKFKSCKFDLLGALVGPLDTPEHLRIVCDLMNFYFAYDEYTDVTDKETARKITEDVMNILRGEEIDSDAPHSCKPLNKMTQEYVHSKRYYAPQFLTQCTTRRFYERTLSVVGHDAPGIDHFIKDFDDYTRSVIVEADERDRNYIRNVDDYFVLRRDTCGAKPSFSFFGLGLNIPSHVFEEPTMLALIDSASDMIAMVNDLHSYGLERSRGLDGHNVITAIMNEHKIDLQAALYWLSGYATRTVARFMSDRAKLPSYGPEVDAAISVFIDRMGRCVRGYDAWSYETDRYYGKNGLTVQKTRRAVLMQTGILGSRLGGYITKKQLGLTLAS
ncbi:isoprenoid synthase domain-containing protein [Panaeolus papilionaceus]|nr:isoprenoid synthase domain-containing protein [Panaeolus papilionaceus]